MFNRLQWLTNALEFNWLKPIMCDIAIIMKLNKWIYVEILIVLIVYRFLIFSSNHILSNLSVCSIIVCSCFILISFLAATTTSFVISLSSLIIYLLIFPLIFLFIILTLIKNRYCFFLFLFFLQWMQLFCEMLIASVFRFK